MLNSFGKIILKSYDEEEFETDCNDFVQNNNFENKPLKNKLIDQVKNERLQKWNSSESINFNNNKKFQPSSANQEVINERQEKCKVSIKKEEIVFEQSEPVSATIFQTNNENTPKSRNQSQPAPVTRVKMKLAETGVFSCHDYSGNSSTDDYFSAFKAPTKPEEFHYKNQSDDDEEIVSI